MALAASVPPQGPDLSDAVNEADNDEIAQVRAESKPSSHQQESSVQI